MKKIIGIIVLIVLAGFAYIVFGDTERRATRIYLQAIQTNIFPNLQESSQAVVQLGKLLSQLQFDAASAQADVAKGYTDDAQEVFNALTPPASVVEFHSLLEQAFVANDSALALYKQGIDQKDMSAIQQGVVKYNEVLSLIKQATEEIKSLNQ